MRPVADWAPDSSQLEATYRRDGVFRGMTGPGTTRIDVILANAVGRATVAKVETVWDMAEAHDHTPLKLTLDIASMNQTVMRAGRPIGLKTELHCYKPRPNDDPKRKEELRRKAEDSYAAITKVFQGAFTKALAVKDVQEAHRLWCLMAEMWLYLSQEAGGEEGPCIQKFLRRSVPRRGLSMPINPEALVPSMDKGADAAVVGIDQVVLEICASARELRRLVSEEAESRQQPVVKSRHYPKIQEGWKGLVAASIKAQTIRLTSDRKEQGEADETLDESSEPTEAEADEEYTLPELGPILKALKKGMKEGQLDGEKAGAEVAQVLQEVYDEAKRRCATARGNRNAHRRKDLQRILNDPSNGHSAFFGTLRADQARPTSVLQTKDGLTANLPRIMEDFQEK